ncbi:MAG: AmmeMemoRadiSam system radical SAM enzyme [Deltaproteobacteria bacterium]|nr:AmmeMemoRadiSam system radical SAM enzyme [Deltaproteobacteria bacterium]
MEAYLYEKMAEDRVRCSLCSHRCIVKPGECGLCHVRENRDGVLHTKVYGRLIARHVDPIEKKPLYHLYPGSQSYSVATVGCNFRCRFCQNADIAQMPYEQDGRILGETVTPDAVVRAALAANCRTIAYTYTEPTVFFEFAYETAKLAHDKGLANVFVSNGYMTAEALEMIGPYLTAANVDLKSFDDRFYKTYCGARLQPVLDTLVRMKSSGILVEVTTLIIPGLNDQRRELASLAGFIAESMGPETPWHISRFHPTYKLTDRPPTPVDTLLKAREIGMAAGLKYVYTGNVPGEAYESTFCPQCGQRIIERWGFSVRDYAIDHGRCKFCGAAIDGLGI